MNTYKSYGKSINGFGELLDEFLKASCATAKEHPATHSKVPVNIQESEEAYTLQVIAPGRKHEDFDISLDKNLMTIATKPSEQKDDSTNSNEKMLRTEYKMLPFKRTFTLTDKVDVNNISAKYVDGILNVTVGKLAPVTPSSIKITVE